MVYKLKDVSTAEFKCPKCGYTDWDSFHGGMWDYKDLGPCYTMEQFCLGEDCNYRHDLIYQLKYLRTEQSCKKRATTVAQLLLPLVK